MPSKAFDRQLAALEELAQSPSSSGAADTLRKALANRNNYIAGKAAQMAARLGCKELVPELLMALNRFFTNAAKADPQCWAKNGIVQALVELGHRESGPYLRGLHHIQMEPVWGGEEDSAGPLRAKCALALVECRDQGDDELLSHLLELLADRDQTVRAEAARAIGRVEHFASELLLRLRALLGDREPAAMGAYFSALLSLEREASFDFVARFLNGNDEVAQEAALALGMTRDLRAFRRLQDCWEGGRSQAIAGTLLTAMALTRQPEAVNFLLRLIETDARPANAAIEALAAARLGGEVRERVEQAVRAVGTERLAAAFQQHSANKE